VNFKTYLLAIVFIITITGCAQNALKKITEQDRKALSNATLTLDAGHHSAPIISTVFTKDKKFLVTAGYDKIIRVYDTKTKKEVRKILGEIAPDDTGVGSGKVFDIALVKDDKYLLVGGYLPALSKEKSGVLRVYEFKSGKLLKVLPAHKISITNIKQYSDSNHFLTTGGRGDVYKWEIGSWKKKKLLDEIYQRKKEKYTHIRQDGVVLIENKLVVATQNKRIMSVDLDSFNQKKVKLKKRGMSRQASNLTSNKHHIAFGSIDTDGQPLVNIYNSRLNKIKHINVDRFVEKVQYNPTGEYLIVGFRFNSEENMIFNIYDVKKDYKLYGVYKEHQIDLSWARDISFLDDYTVVTPDESGSIYKWSLKTLQGEEFIKGAPGIIKKLELKDDSILVEFNDKDKSKFQFNLKKLFLSKNNSLAISSLPKKIKNISIEKEAIDGNPDNYLTIKQDGKIIKRLKNKKYKGGKKWTTIGLTDDGKIIAGLVRGNLFVFDKNGKRLANLSKHQSYATAIGYKDNIVVTAGKDHIIKFWNLNDIPKNSKKIRPFINLYIGQNNDWVIWTADGFYDSSKEDIGIGWHVDTNSNKESYFYAVKQFSRYLYRPDIIEKTIQTSSRLKALNYFYKDEPELRKVTSAQLINRAPTGFYINNLQLLSPNKARLQIKFQDNNANRPDSIAIFVNASQVLPKFKKNDTSLALKDTLEYDIPLLAKENIVKVSIQNKWAEGTASTYIESLNFKPKAKKLYMLAVGINDYKQVGIPSLVSPQKDAINIAKYLSKNKNYTSVEQKVLLSSNETITSKLILDELVKISNKSEPQDDIVVFFAGHGITNSKGYNFVTQDARASFQGNFIQNSKRGLLVKKEKQIKSTNNQETYEFTFKKNTTLDWKRLNDTLAQIRGRKMIIVDSCQAGGVMKKIKPSLRKLAKDIHSTESIIMSASTSQEFAVENNKNGLFTSALLNSIEKTDNNLMFSELSSNVTQYVQKATKGKQNPTITKPENLVDFIFFQN
jgi:WD40 repeat protein